MYFCFCGSNLNLKSQLAILLKMCRNTRCRYWMIYPNLALVFIFWIILLNQIYNLFFMDIWKIWIVWINFYNINFDGNKYQLKYLINPKYQKTFYHIFFMKKFNFSYYIIYRCTELFFSFTFKNVFGEIRISNVFVIIYRIKLKRNFQI